MNLKNIYAFNICGRENCNLHANSNENLPQFLSWKTDSIYFVKFLVIYLVAVTQSTLVKTDYARCIPLTHRSQCGHLQNQISKITCRKAKFHEIWRFLGGRQPVTVLSLSSDFSWTANVASDCIVDNRAWVLFAQCKFATDTNYTPTQPTQPQPNSSRAIKWNCNTEMLVLCTCRRYYSPTRQE